MRGGKLLTQARPEDLIRAYNAVVCIIVTVMYTTCVCTLAIDVGRSICQISL